MTGQTPTQCPHCLHSWSDSSASSSSDLTCPACHASFQDDEQLSLSASLTQAEQPSASISAQQETQAVAATGVESAVVSAQPRRRATHGADATGPAARSQEEKTLRKLGRFELKSILGHGAFGKVYRAYDPKLERFVALKIPVFGPDQKTRISRFATEAKAAARLKHANIVTTFESGKVGKRFYIASEHIEGQLLSTRITNGPVSTQTAVGWIQQLAAALAYAHEQGIVHRDVKPGNVMIDTSGKPQLMDFGLAKRLDDECHLTADGALLGSPAYMAPEQARGEIRNVGPHSDQYSLAVVLYHLLTGAPPCEGSPHVVVAEVARGKTYSPQQVNPTIDDDLDAICRKAMAPNSVDRYSSCLALASDLQAWREGAPVRVRPLSSFARAKRFVVANQLWVVLSSLVGCLLMFVVVAGYLVWRAEADAAAQQIAVAADNQDAQADEDSDESTKAGDHDADDESPEQPRTPSQNAETADSSVEVASVKGSPSESNDNAVNDDQTPPDDDGNEPTRNIATRVSHGQTDQQASIPVTFIVGDQKSPLKPRYSPYGTQLKLKPATIDDESLGFDPLITEIRLGPDRSDRQTLPILVTRAKPDEAYSKLYVDENRDGKFDEAAIVTAARESRGSLSSSFNTILKVAWSGQNGLENDQYAVGLWIVVKKAADVPELMRYSRRGFKVADVNVGDHPAHVVLSDGNNDARFGEGDFWELVPQPKPAGRSVHRRLPDFLWLEGNAWKLELDTDRGQFGKLVPHDPGMTEEEDAEARDRYAADRNAPRAAAAVKFRDDITAAIQDAAKKKQLCFLKFEADWCGPCQQMNKIVFTAKAVADVADDIVCVKVDADKHDDVVQKHKVRGYPTGILLNSDGSEKSRFVGYQSVAATAAFLSGNAVSKPGPTAKPNAASTEMADIALDKLPTFELTGDTEGLRARFEKNQQQLERYLPMLQRSNNTGHIIVGQVVVEEGDEAEMVKSQMALLPDGCFVGITKDLIRPVGFRMHQYAPFDLDLAVKSGQVVDVGVIEMRKLPPNELVMFHAQVELEGETDASNAKVTLSVSGGPVNTPSNGTEPRRRWTEPVTVPVAEDGQTHAGGFSPMNYYCSVSAPGYVSQSKSVLFNPGSGADLGLIFLEKPLRMKLDFIVQKDAGTDFDPNTVESWTVKGGDRWKATPDIYGWDLEFKQDQGSLNFNHSYSPCYLKDLGKGEINDFLDVAKSERKGSLRGKHVQDGHVYLLNQAHWKRFVLFRASAVK